MSGPHLTLLPSPEGNPAPESLPPTDPAKARQELSQKLERISSKLLDHLEENVGKLKPSEAAFAAGVMIDKKRDLEAVRTQTHIHNTVVVQGLTRAEALRFLTGTPEATAQQAPGASSRSLESAMPLRPRRFRPTRPQPGQEPSQTSHNGFNTTGGPSNARPQNTSSRPQNSSEPLQPSPPAMQQSHITTQSAATTASSLGPPGRSSPEVLLCSHEKRTEGSQAGGDGQVQESPLEPVDGLLEGKGGLLGDCEGGLALPELPQQASYGGQPGASAGQPDGLGNAQVSRPEAPAAAGSPPDGLTEGTQKEGLT